MRILVCAAQPPLEPLTGFRLQLHHLCRELARRNDVTVLAFRVEGQTGEPPPGVELIELPAPARGVAALAWQSARAALRRTPRSVQMVTNAMAAAAARLLSERDFDVVHVAGSMLAGVAPALAGRPAVLSALDAWHLNSAADVSVASGLDRQLRRLEARNVRRFEARAYRPFSCVVMVSDRDADAVRSLDPGLRVEVVPNGVEAERFAPAPGTPREAGLVVFTGSMNWAPNVEAAECLVREILPRLRRQVERARVAIVGRDPTPAVKALAELDGVEVTGEVPDVRPWLWRAQVFACPMVSGAGIKNKLLEALACATPAIATPLASESIRSPQGALLVADGPDALAGAAASLIRDPTLAERVGRAGRALVAQRYSWSRVASEFERLYRRAIDELESVAA